MAGIDVAASAAADSALLQGEFRQATFDAEFEDRTDGSLSEYLNGTADNITNTTADLDARHASVIANFSAGDISLDRLLRELVHLTAAANAQQAYAEHLLNRVSAQPDLRLQTELRRQLLGIEIEIAALESPVTDKVRRSTVARGASVYAQASDEALLLAVPGEPFVRQVTLRNQRDADGVNQFFEQDGNANSNALSRADELYENVGGFSPPPLDATAVYGIQGTTPVGVGSFTAYLDGATTNIFHEVLTIDPETVPASRTVTNSTNGVTITAEATAATGPLHVTVTRNDLPIDGATLSIDEQTVGTTDVDGTRWVVQPMDTFEVTASLDNESVSVTVPDSN